MKSPLAHIHADDRWARVVPPLTTLAASDRDAVVTGYEPVRAKRVT
ncbi:MAG: hypothetical protein KGK33_03610 [Hyphomicrobiales bacterium]|nr:hypothetical protein [Hyphomicrobiales bacterium]